MGKTQRTFMLNVIVLVCGANFVVVANSSAGEQATDVITEFAPAATRLSKEIRRAADLATPGLVTVYALRGPRMTKSWRLREAAKTQPHLLENGNQDAASSLTLSPDGQGSGIVIDSRGYILTCSHVVAGADAVFIRTADGRKFHADEVHCDPASDLALIRVKENSELQEAKLGDSDEIDVGDWVVSLASPYDLEKSLSAGIVTTKQRWVPSSPHPFIQNDAATNPGSSGGALLNLHGEVVGVIVGGYSTCSTGEFQGIGLATPIKTAKMVAEQLRTLGYVRRNWFGIQAQLLTSEMAKLLEPSIDVGLYVTDVQRDSPASRAGLFEGDIITELDGQPVDKSFDPQFLTADSTPGKKQLMTVLRDHKSVELELEMKDPQPPVAIASNPSEVSPVGSFEHFDSNHGLGLSQLTPELIRELDLPVDTQGALVTHVAFDSDAYREEVAAGTVIARINDKAVKNISSYQEITSELNTDKPVLLLLQSDQAKYLVMLPMIHRHKHE